MQKIITIIGARPQFIKAAVVSSALADEGIQEVIIHTGQHYDANMSDVFFQELGIPVPKMHLGVGSGHHGAQTGAMLVKLEEVMLAEQPDCVLVYGDTNSTLAGALAAAKLHIPIAHVEAGLRSYNKCMPEEINRVMTDHVSKWLFAPTEQAVSCLAKEGITGPSVHQVGDVMYDAALRFGKKAKQSSALLRKHLLQPKQYILATIHRAENTDEPTKLLAILQGLALASRELPVILPLHPRTRHVIEKSGLPFREHALHVIDPVGYLDMVALESDAALIVTDSGGVQKEAFFHQVPCVTLRTETEWTELVTLGWNRLQAPDSSKAIAATLSAALGSKGKDEKPYGDGSASEHIARILKASL